MIRLLRLKQWVKNLFVFIPLFFSGGARFVPSLLSALEGFFCFCLLSSCIYIINDINDAEADHLHPVKCRRPIPSGRVRPGAAWCVAAVLLIASFALAICCFWGNGAPLLVLGGYFLINILYTYGLKRVAILDVMIIAAGFVLRVMMGGVCCGVWVSPWLVMMVFLLTLMIAFGKRRDDVRRIGEGEEVRRESAIGYNLHFINQVLGLLAGIVIVAYICYTLTPGVEERFGSGYVYLTSVFVIAGILRFLQITIVKQDSGDPTDMIFSDRFIQVCCILWGLSFVGIIYL